MNEILLFIYNSKAIKSSAKKITKGDDLWQDLVSELLIIVSEMDFKVVSNLFKENKLEIYCYKIMYYQFTNPNMSFYKKYRSFECVQPVETKDQESTDIDVFYSEVKALIEKIEKNISKKRYPTEIRLLELYVKEGTFRKVSKEVGISFKTAQYMVKQLTEKIKKKYDLSYNR